MLIYDRRNIPQWQVPPFLQTIHLYSCPARRDSLSCKPPCIRLNATMSDKSLWCEITYENLHFHCNIPPDSCAIKPHHEPDTAVTWELGWLWQTPEEEEEEEEAFGGQIWERCVSRWVKRPMKRTSVCAFIWMLGVQVSNRLRVALRHLLRPHNNVIISQSLSTCHTQ